MTLARAVKGIGFEWQIQFWCRRFSRWPHQTLAPFSLSLGLSISLCFRFYCLNRASKVSPIRVCAPAAAVAVTVHTLQLAAWYPIYLSGRFEKCNKPWITNPSREPTRNPPSPPTLCHKVIDPHSLRDERNPEKKSKKKEKKNGWVTSKPNNNTRTPVSRALLSRCAPNRLRCKKYQLQFQSDLTDARNQFLEGR